MSSCSRGLTLVVSFWIWDTAAPGWAKAKAKTYSTIKSSYIGSPNAAVTAAAIMMMPVASPATQWIIEPIACFQSGLMNCSCVPGAGSLQERM